MKATYLNAAGAIALTFAIAACSTGLVPDVPAPVAAPAPASLPAPEATPSPAPPPPPPPPPASVQEPVYENYLDAPQTPGSWTYVNEPNETLALFGASVQKPVFMIRCAGGRVALARVLETDQSAPRSMSLTAETGTRTLEASPVRVNPIILAAELDPRDGVLDAIAITKGRFAVAMEGARTLYLPAWVEVSRVIEDCR